MSAKRTASSVPAAHSNKGKAQRAAASAKKPSSPANGNRRTATARTGNAQARPGRQATMQAEWMDGGPHRSIKNDIAGVVAAVCGLVLLIIVAMPGDAIGSRLISDLLRLAMGIGAFLLPFLMIAWGVTFFIRGRVNYASARVIVGSLLVFLAVLALFATATPMAASQPVEVFAPSHVSQQGGYLGAAVAFVGISLVGQIATVVILIGVAVVGVVLVGFSITRLIERVSGFAAQKRQKRLALPQDDQGPYGAYDMGDGHASGKGRSYLAPTRLYGADNDDSNLDDAGLDDVHAAAGMTAASALANGAGLGATRRLISRGRMGVDSAVNEGLYIDRGRAANLVDDGQVAGFGDAALQLGASGEDAPDVGGSSMKTADLRRRGKADANGQPASRDAGQPSPPLSDFKLPDMRILRVSREKAATKAGISELKATAMRLQATLEEFGVDGEVIGWIAGPTVTLYKVSLGAAVRVNRVASLLDDIQLSLAALAIRMVAPIPGTSLVGIEIPNGTRQDVLLGDVLPSAQAGALQLAIGKDVEGDAIVADLAAMPHLLIGGTTGSGKSVAINAIIMSILMRATPAEVRMIMVDPKRVELTLYNGIPHLYVPVVTDANQAASALAWAVVEMERRLKVFEKHGAKNIRQFNNKVAEETARREKEEARQQAGGAAPDTRVAPGCGSTEAGGGAAAGASGGAAAGASGGASSFPSRNIAAEQDDLAAAMPYIVIVIDELADLMTVAGKDVETSISRLAQLARAAGLHLIVATQRPSTNVITGLIKANIVNRIAFTVASGIDSRVILDAPGADKLIGRGDLLFSRPEHSKPTRIQGCFVSEPEIETVVAFLRTQGEPDYHNDILAMGMTATGFGGMGGSDDLGDDDPLVWEAAEIVVSSGLGSTSTLQRRLKVGYARAGRIMDMLEMKGIVGPPNGSKPRDVLFDDVLDLETLKAFDGR